MSQKPFHRRLPTLDAHVLGQLIDLYQRVTIYTGLLYGINPLDQPAVELGKQLTLRYLGETANATTLTNGRTSTASRASDSSRGPRLDPIGEAGKPKP